MIITKIGEITKEFKFICGNCNSEWYADRKEVKFTPPFMEFEAYMKCPCCGYTTYSKESEKV